jgi:hypothetical protein
VLLPKLLSNQLIPSETRLALLHQLQQQQQIRLALHQQQIHLARQFLLSQLFRQLPIRSLFPVPIHSVRQVSVEIEFKFYIKFLMNFLASTFKFVLFVVNLLFPIYLLI